MPRLVISQRDRLLLHLLEMEPFRAEVEVPLGACQEGIAQRLSTQVHNISRALSSLQGEGLVLDRLAHVHGAQKRRKAYFLTDKGTTAAEALVQEIMRHRVLLEDAGECRETDLSGIAETVKGWGKSPSMFEISEAARTYDKLSILDLRSRFGREGSKVATRSRGRPRLDSFFGREREKRDLSSLLKDPEKRLILITGLAGIGKSTLASWAFESNLGRVSQLWHTINEWEGRSSLPEELSEFFSSIGAVDMAIGSQGARSFTDLYGPLLKDVTATRPTIFLDDVHKASETALPFLMMLSDVARAVEGAKLVLVSRTVPVFFPIGRLDCAHLELSGLDSGAARDMAEHLHLNDVDTAVRESRGHPLLLGLMATSGVTNAKGDASTFLEKEVDLGLEAGEREVLETLSIYRHPVPANALGDERRASVISLRAKGLIMEDERGLRTHDLLSSFFLARLGMGRTRDLHALAARYCASHQELDWRMEAFYHAVEASDEAMVRDLVVDEGEALAISFPGEVESLLLKASGLEMGDENMKDILSALALTQEEMGHETLALETYDRLLMLLERSGDERLASIIQRKARLQAETKRWVQAFELHERALELYRTKGDRSGEAREWLSLGSAHRRKGETAKAREAFNRAYELAVRIGDSAAEAAALNDLALVEWDEGGLRQAEELLERAVAGAHHAGDGLGEGLASENLSSLLKSQERYDEALMRLEEAASAFRRGHDEEERKRVIATRSDMLAEMGREEEAEALLRAALLDKSEESAKRLRRGRIPGKEDIRLQRMLVRLLRESGRLEEAEAEASRLEGMASGSGDVRSLAKARIEKAAVLEDAGRFDLASAALGKAREDLSMAGDAEGLAVVLMRMAALDKRRGDKAGAKIALREALRQSILSGSKLAEASVLEELGCSLDGEERQTILNRAMDIYSQMRRRIDMERVKGMLE